VQASTVSTALDQIRLAQVAYALAPIRQIVAMPEVTLPVAGRQYNVDSLLGHDGIVGIKTGTTSQAGGCFVFASRLHFGRRIVTVIGAVLHQQPSAGAPSLFDAVFKATTDLLAKVPAVIRFRTFVRRGEPLAVLTVPWSRTVALEARRSVRMVGWGGLAVERAIAVTTPLTSSIRDGQEVAVATVSVGGQRVSVPLVAAGGLVGPSLGWRLTHP
jgi:D-alanyl-D-alanine carboxypeptidase (penicillin-binding protein 5/6)